MIAPPGYSRWLVPPAALAIHLSIGQAYAFSVFNLPLTRVVGVTSSAPSDWTLTDVGWVFTLAIVCLGLSAAFGGKWLERVGPRTSGVTAAACWGIGFLLSALAVRLHSLPLLLFGYGVVGGTGLGLGYITPVSTLIKWFPDRRGMATGMAIMGFGGGAMIASPLSERLLRLYATESSTGVAATFTTLGVVYAVAMLAGAFAFRVPAPGWKPAGYVPKTDATGHQRVEGQVHAARALATPQFYLLWLVLFLNVTAGIGVLGQASPMIQEVFKDRVDAAMAAGFVGLLSLFNMAGRFFWSSISDRIGRKATYAVFFLLGPALYLAVPLAGKAASVPLFVAAFAAILTMYGGGFATIPAYLADVFGTQYVGAIHGRLLTAWSAAGVAGPVLVNYLRSAQIARGVPKTDAYDFTMHLMAGLLVGGFVANLLVRPVDARFHMTPEELEADRRARASTTASVDDAARVEEPSRVRETPPLVIALAWGAASLPLGWGVVSTFGKTLKLFGG
jgi:MFS family permease